MFWSKPDLTLRSVEAKREGDYTRSLNAGISGAWIYPYVFAQGNVGWNEKTLPVLASTVDLVPEVKLDSSLAATKDQPSAGFWKIVNDFNNQAVKPPADGATFAMLVRPDVEDLMPRIARAVLKAVPDASVKFVIRLDKKPEVAVIRLAFDGKKEHRAWIRRAGEKSGGPLTGWETWTPPVVPALPPLPPTQPH
jgi:hypothetical protein